MAQNKRLAAERDEIEKAAIEWRVTTAAARNNPGDQDVSGSKENAVVRIMKRLRGQGDEIDSGGHVAAKRGACDRLSPDTDVAAICVVEEAKRIIKRARGGTHEGSCASCDDAPKRARA